VRCSKVGKHTRLWKGWKQFASDKNLQLGDICLLELLRNKEYTMNVHIIRSRWNVVDLFCWSYHLLLLEEFSRFCLIDKHLKAYRPLIRVLVINDNGLWINNFIWDNEYRLIHEWKRFGCERMEFWRWWAKLGLKAKVK
jgi:hypothetical protein